MRLVSPGIERGLVGMACTRGIHDLAFATSLSRHRIHDTVFATQDIMGEVQETTLTDFF